VALKLSLDSLADGWAKALSVDRKHFNLFYERMMDGFAYHKIIVDTTGKPIDYVFLEVNKAFEKMTGLKKEAIIGKKVTEVLKGIENDPADWIGRYGKVALTCEPAQFENYAAALDKWYKVSAYCPEKGYFVTLFEDITERKKAEETLKITLDRFYTSLSNMHGSILLVSAEGQVEFVNQSFCEYFNLTESPSELKGFSVENIIKKIAPSYLNPDHEINRIKEIVAVGKSVVGEEVAMAGNRTCLRDFIPLHKAGGSFSRLWHHTDITQQKKNEKALRESEQRWATTLSSIGDAVIATDTEGKITFLNKVAEELTGWTLQEASTHPLDKIFNIINEQTRQKVENPVTRVLKEGMVVGLANHTLLVRKDGHLVPIDDSGAPIKDKEGKTTGVVLVFRDITERKKSDEMIAQQAFMLANANDAIIGYDFEQKVTFWNKAAEKLYGYTTEEALRKTGFDLFKPIYLGVKRENVLDKLATEGHVETESTRQTKEGKTLNIEAHVILLRDEAGKSIGYVSVDRDITERKMNEAVLQRQAALIDLSPDAIIVRTLVGTITFWSKGAEKLYGWTKEEVVGKKTHNIFRTKFPQPLETILQELKSSQRWTGELVHCTKQGTEVTVQSWWLAEKTEQGEIKSVLESNIDLTERKRAEEARAQTQVKLEENAIMLEEYATQMDELANQRATQLKDSERMAAIGQTAGMVGHDIRNPLQAITSDMYLIAEETKNMPEGEGKQSILESVQSITENLSYINKIVSDLQDYTRPLKPSFQNADLAELIQGTVLTINVPKRIAVTTNVTDNAKAIKTDVAYLRRMLTNLLTNAVQAMPNAGEITVNACKKKDRIIVSVQDTGVGIPEHVKTKMFTPLFTTKSKGQGLGLAVIKRLVEALNGTISFESQENQGTKFIIELPQAE
jgi:PAS domain S-box-containing protein